MKFIGLIFILLFSIELCWAEIANNSCQNNDVRVTLSFDGQCESTFKKKCLKINLKNISSESLKIEYYELVYKRLTLNITSDKAEILTKTELSAKHIRPVNITNHKHLNNKHVEILDDITWNLDVEKYLTRSNQSVGELKKDFTYFVSFNNVYLIKNNERSKLRLNIYAKNE